MNISISSLISTRAAAAYQTFIINSAEHQARDNVISTTQLQVSRRQQQRTSGHLPGNLADISTIPPVKQNLFQPEKTCMGGGRYVWWYWWWWRAMIMMMIKAWWWWWWRVMMIMVMMEGDDNDDDEMHSIYRRRSQTKWVKEMTESLKHLLYLAACLTDSSSSSSLKALYLPIVDA